MQLSTVTSNDSVRLYESLPAAVYTCDQQGRITYFNQRAIELWGKAPRLADERDRFCGSHRLFALDGAPIRHEQCWMALALKHGRAFVGEAIVIERPNGTRVVAMAHATPIRDEDGAVVGAVNLLVEIPSGSHANELSNRLAAIIESSDDAIVSKTLDGVITSWNKGAERIFGYTAEEMVGKPVTMLMPPDRVNEEQAILAKLRKGERVEHFETRRVTKDMRIIDVSLTISPIRDSRGVIVGASKIARDITQKKAAEAALRSMNEALEAKVAERTALAEQRARQLSVVATELIDAEQKERRKFAQVLHDDLAQNLALAKMRLSMIPTSTPQGADVVKQSTDVIGDLIDATRRLMNDMSPTLLYELGLEAALKNLAERWQKEHGLHVDVQMLGEPRGMTEQISTFIFRAVREALFNVVKHARTDKARVTLDQQNPQRIVVEIADDGIGFDASQYTHSHEAGEHFGLYSIRERAALLSGNLQINSSRGAGTIVRLFLPLGWLAQSPEAPEAKGSSAPSIADRQETAGAIRVVLVDDHVVMREGLANLLSKQSGLSVIGQAGDGVEAIELARSLKPDVMVMDVSMPRMSGLEATRVIHKEQPEIRIIGLSMHESATMGETMRTAGAHAFVAKGEHPRTLIEAIQGKSV